MDCPKCQTGDTQVIDSRETGESAVRRRRECLDCEYRFTTYERVEKPNLRVVKKDGRRERFDLDKIRRGVYRAFEKLEVPTDEIEEMLKEVEQEIYESAKEEIDTREIGEIVLQKIKDMHQVAYIRFASVYREFVDVEDFEEEIQKTA